MSARTGGILHRVLPGFLHPAVDTAASALARHRARRQLAGQQRLHLACGMNLMPGWANVDIDGPASVIRLDLTHGLPIDDDSVEYVFCEHFIEHIPLQAALGLLREVRRCLRHGGVVRLSTPDLGALVEHYRAGRLDTWQDVGWQPETSCRLLNEGMHSWGHQFVFDQPELERALSAAGFSSVARVSWRQSDHAPLAGLECRPFHGELIYEATK